MTAKARPVLVFDVNETLLDLEHLTPLFARVFGDGRVMREWFAQTILYSQTLTLGGAYVPLGTIGAGILRMLGTLRALEVTGDDVAELKERLVTMPAHDDVVLGLQRLKAAGFRLATLTNSPPQSDGGPLRRAGIDTWFDRRLSVDDVQKFKPARATYQLAADQLGVDMSDICLVACHVWDTLGAQLHGASSALLLRAGNTAIPIDGLPQPTIVASDMDDLADQAIRRWG